MARRATPTDASGLPDKPYFKIGEAARLCGGQALRAALLGDRVQVGRPQKTRSQQRLYRRRDVELLLKIRHLLYEKRFTIEGARARLRELGHDEGPAPLPPPPESDVSRETLRKIKQGLADLIRICAE